MSEKYGKFADKLGGSSAFFFNSVQISRALTPRNSVKSSAKTPKNTSYGCKF